MCTKWRESLPYYSWAICWNQAATWDRIRKDSRRKCGWKWKTGDEIGKEDRTVNTREISMSVRMNILLLLYLPLFVCISPCLPLFPLSSALHLLYSANVFCLLSPASSLSFPLSFPPSTRPPWSEGESDCEEGSRSCENNWKPNFRQALMDLFPQLKTLQEQSGWSPRKPTLWGFHCKCCMSGLLIFRNFNILACFHENY